MVDNIELSPVNAQQNDKKNDFISKEDIQKEVSKLVRIEMMNLKKKKIQRRMRFYYTNTYIYFHLIMILSSFYLVALLTNYGSLKFNSPVSWSNVPSSESSLNIKIGLSYFVIFTYIWIIAAPHIFSNR